MSQEQTFLLLKNTLEGKVKNLERIPCCSKESMLDAIKTASSWNDLIGINSALKRLISKG